MPLLLAVAGCLIVVVGLMAIGADGYYDERSEKKVGTVNKFCELNRPGLIREPANAFSSLVICLPAFAILRRWSDMPADGWLGAHDLAPDRPPSSDPFSRRSPELVAFCIAALLVGLSSFAAHGTKMRIAGTMDSSTMVLWILVPMLWSARRLAGFSRPVWLSFWLLGSLGIAWYMWATKGVGVTDAYFALIPVWLVLELFAWWRIGRPSRWVVTGVGLFGLAYGAWLLGLEDSSTCVPGSLLQWHALWHILCAAAIYAIWRHLVASPLRFVSDAGEADASSPAG